MATDVTVTKVYANPDYWQGGGSPSSYSFTSIGGGGVVGPTMTWIGNTVASAVATYGGETTIRGSYNLTFNESYLRLNNGAYVDQWSLYMLLGADSPGYVSRTQYTQHDGYVTVVHYDGAEEPLTVIGGSAQNTENYVNIGGGHASLNAATQINFYVATNTTTVTGTAVAYIDDTGFHTNSIREFSVGAGVTIDNSVLIQDGAVYLDGLDSAPGIYITYDSAGNMVFADAAISAGEVALSDLIGGGSGGGYWSRNVAGYVYPTTTTDYISMNPIDIRDGTASVISYDTVYYNIFFGTSVGTEITTEAGNVLIGGYCGQYLAGAGNICLGNSAGTGATGVSDGTYNVAIGYAAATDIRSNDHNVAIGTQAGNYLRGDNGIFIGRLAGYGDSGGTSTGAANIMMGYFAGRDYTTGANNIMIGYEAGRYATTPTYTVALGYNAYKGDGATAPTGYSNVAIGYWAGHDMQGAGYCVLIGHQAGQNVTSGSSTIALGSNAGGAITSGSGNVAIGNYAMAAISTTGSNVAIGNNAMNYASAGASNVAIGPTALGYCIGSFNVAVGPGAGNSGLNKNNNVFIGSSCGTFCEGDYNIYVGQFAGRGDATSTGSTGDSNIGIGRSSLYAIDEGQYNVAIGGYSGDTIESGNYNIILGYQVDVDAESDSYLFRVGYSTNYLIEGNMQSGSQELTINGDFYLPGISNSDSAETLQYVPSTGAVTYFDDTSDKRLKQDVKPIKNASAKLSKYSTFTYRFNATANEVMGHDMEKVRLGMFAQDVMADFPEAVSEKSNGYYKLQYTDLIPVIVSGHNEHTKEIAQLKKQIRDLNRKIRSMA